jgi:serine/threonine-protein kinase
MPARPGLLENALARDPSSHLVDSVEARAFFQSRLATFALATLFLSGTAWLSLAVAQLVVGGDPSVDHAPFSTGGTLHFIGVLGAAAMWLATRRGERVPSVLDAFDIGGTLAIIGLFVAAGGVLAPGVGTFVGLLAFLMGTLTRAVVVPSTARRSLFVGLMIAAEVMAFAVWSGQSAGRGAVQAVVATTCWGLAGVALGTFASHTIFGLRRQVRRAHILGQYRLEAKIGEGGMGEVWRASHALLCRPTAVKLLPPERMGEDAIRRFEREVQMTALLTHPGTVAIYDYGRTRDGIFYYAMELLDGTDLESLVRQYGPQPSGRVVHILVQICGALAEAHDLGLVHRDVKPANIVLSPRSGEHEFAKILDFGLVKAIPSELQLGSALSGANTITGTPLYISPEAIRAPKSVDARSDLYALGAVAWFLLVGRPPFGGQNMLEVCSKHLQTAPEHPSTALGQPIPPDLEDAVLACLEKRPEARPADARALRDLLERSTAAGQWSATDAAAWWQERQPRRVPGVEHALARTIELDMEARATTVGAKRQAPEG